MTFYWTLKSVPELSGLSPRERQQVHHVCYSRHVFRSARCLIALCLCGLCGGAGVAVGSFAHLLFGVQFSIWHVAIGGGIGGGLGGFYFGQTVTSYLRPFYAAYINKELRRDVV
jgi:hypothetical protein